MTVPGVRFTAVFFHAHPDDEALLTSGTMCRATADGHRVVLVVATAGEQGLTQPDVSSIELGHQRARELTASAAALGVARLELLGYPDSGSVPGPRCGSGTPFSQLPVDEVAHRLAALLREEKADVLTIYDQGGGYGHPDHVQVHLTGLRAAELAGTPVVLEATVDRRLISPVVRAMRGLSWLLPMPEQPATSTLYTAHADLTHRVDVRSFLDEKLRAMRAHASQSTGGPRTLSLLGKLPGPLGRRVLGREWFREIGRSPNGRLLDDIFASLRP